MKQYNLDKYLDSKGVLDKTYREFLSKNDSDLEFKLCSVSGFDFMVDHFLDASDIRGYGIIPTNETLKLTETTFLAIGLIEGDDIICMDVTTGKIILWLIQTGIGEHLLVADSFADFLKSCGYT